MCFNWRKRVIKLDYVPELVCYDCRLRGLLRYVLICKCRHVICVFCKEQHNSKCCGGVI